MDQVTSQTKEKTLGPLRSGASVVWRSFAILGLISAPVVLSACNTVEGVGRDVESAGDGIADAAERND